MLRRPFVSAHQVRHRTRLFLLSVSWSATATFTAVAAQPISSGELPAAAATGEAAPAGDLLAQTNAPASILPPPPEPPSPSQSVTINLINRLVARGLLPKEDADELIKQAEAEAAAARAQAALEQEVALQTAVAQAVATVQANPLLADPGPAPSDAIRVTYIPEVVKAQMREQIKADVLAQTRHERLGGGGKAVASSFGPRFRLFGDVRVRGEGLYYPSGNDNSGAFPNFNAINTGAPFDVAGTVFSPQLNVDQDRQRLRLRVRLGAEIDLLEGFSAGVRLATGENNSPTSPNQSLGIANQGQGGNFSKYAIWLDRGFLKYEVGGQPERNLAIFAGRFDNPFFSTDILYDDDLGFDGLGLQARYEVLPGFTPFVAGGAFPIFNTDLNFSSNQPEKFASDDKWLYGVQLGADWKITKDLSAKFAAAYYAFDNVAGRLSDPYTPLTAQDAGNTDNTRPSFAQKGNTYRALRDIVPTVDNDFGTSRQFQYFGLATPFRNLALTGKLDYHGWEPVHIVLSGEYVKNLEFDAAAIDAIAVNNRGPNQSNGNLGTFDGGDTAWIVGVKVGSAALEKRWDWNLGLNYRYVESDAVIDGLTDSDFGGGGTNLEGYAVGGSLALSSRVWLGIRWMSANEIAGPPFKNDTLQIDLNGKF